MAISFHSVTLLKQNIKSFRMKEQFEINIIKTVKDQFEIRSFYL